MRENDNELMMNFHAYSEQQHQFFRHCALDEKVNVLFDPLMIHFCEFASQMDAQIAFGNSSFLWIFLYIFYRLGGRLNTLEVINFLYLQVRGLLFWRINQLLCKLLLS